MEDAACQWDARMRNGKKTASRKGSRQQLVKKVVMRRMGSSMFLRLPLNKQGSDAANLRWIPSALAEIQGIRRNPSRPGSQPRDLHTRKQRGLGAALFAAPSGFAPLSPSKAAPRVLCATAEMVFTKILEEPWMLLYLGHFDKLAASRKGSRRAHHVLSAAKPSAVTRKVAAIMTARARKKLLPGISRKMRSESATPMKGATA